MSSKKQFIFFNFLFILSGTLAGLGYPFNDDQYSLIAPIVGNTIFYYIILKYINLKNYSTKMLLLGCTLCLYAGNLVGFSWVPQTINLFSKLEGIPAFFAGAGFILVSCPPFWVIVFMIIAMKSNLGPIKLKDLYQKCPNQVPLVLAFIITMVGELIPFVFPLKIGSSWIRFAPYLGFAPLFGIAFYSFLTHFISLEIVKFTATKKFPITTFFILGVWLIYHLASPLTPGTDGVPVTVRIIQANIESEIKYLRKKDQRKNWKILWPRYKVPSEKNLPNNLDLLIWPETSYPFFMNTKTGENFSGQYINISKKVGNLLFGGIDHQGKKKYVSNMLFTNGEFRQVYHKRKLIPFAETIIFNKYEKQIRKLLPGAANFRIGKNPHTFNLGNHKTFMTPICYEILFLDYIRHALNDSNTQVNFLINTANDAWFRSSREVHQHEFMARWTAMIFQKPVVRSLNTGRSSIIAKDGSFIDRLPNLKAGVIDNTFSIFPKQSDTLYQQWGLFSFIIFIFFTLLLHFILEQIKRALIKRPF